MFPLRAKDVRTLGVNTSAHTTSPVTLGPYLNDP